MKKLRYFLLLTLVALIFGHSAHAAILAKNLRLKALEVKNDAFMFVAVESVDTTAIGCFAFPDEKGYPQLLLYYDSADTVVGINDKDNYKMMWTQLNTALALRRPVSLNIESGYGMCFIRSVKIHDGL